jgi:glycosyltransferase involved in cell wall biosynthesis
MSANATVVPGAVGLTAIQSLNYGTPVITHDDPNEQGPEWEAIRNGLNGRLFRKGDPVDLAEAIEEWTRNNLPDEKAREKCFRSVDRCYTPSYQVQVMDAAITGRSADE